MTLETTSTTTFKPSSLPTHQPSHYTQSLYTPIRRVTRTVMVGDVEVGGDYPIVVQSMTTPSTKDTQATVDQIERLVKAGCQIVRVTTPSMGDVENIPNIRKEMKNRGISVPLVADVHFLPNVALRACELVEKVRINPGNFADKKKFAQKEYTDDEYDSELERVRNAFRPVVLRAKDCGAAMRIGTNHGSLSDRIMNRFGDTPLGMVESALEFVRFAEEEKYFDIILSMKASNTQVMIQAYRLLVKRMDELGMKYPLHLGVTEAGDGEDGRTKSAIGIGSLLADGLGDTIRVSLTEDPVEEIPVARNLVQMYGRREHLWTSESQPQISWDPYSYQRRETLRVNTKTSSGGKEIVRVRTFVDAAHSGAYTELLSPKMEPPVEAVSIDNTDAGSYHEFRSLLDPDVSLVLRVSPGKEGAILKENLAYDELSLPVSPAWAEARYAEKLQTLLKDRPAWFRARKRKDIESIVPVLKALQGKAQVGIELEGWSLIYLARWAVATFDREGVQPPMHLRYVADPTILQSHEVLLRASVELGSLLCDGFGDSIEVVSSQSPSFNHRLAFNILQASRLRMSKTEYIACPSCGRTLFDLEEVTARIRSQTSQLKGVKIAIMGCIVNGPGEMADADFGYVGSGPGYINLYVGKDCVERQVPEAEADQRLIALIKNHGKWIEPT